MRSISSLSAGYKINEYLLVLTPPGKLYSEIRSIKCKFTIAYDAPLAAQTYPHLSLVTFPAYQKMEERILARFQQVGMSTQPFDVELNDYGMFESSKAIFINVANKSVVQDLVQELKSTRHLLRLNAEYGPLFINNPHITICRGLTSLQYQQASVVYSKLSFAGRFTAGSMTLLKKPYGENKYMPAGSFAFQGMPVLVKQGNLFMNQTTLLL